MAEQLQIEIENSHKAEVFILNMKPIDNSIRVLTELSKLCEIKIATNRPALADKATKKWLRKHRIPFDYYINTSKDGKGAASGNLIIDDYPKNTLDFTQHEGRTAFLFNQPWNEQDTSTKENPKIARVKDWDEVLDKIRNIPYK